VSRLFFDLADGKVLTFESEAMRVADARFPYQNLIAVGLTLPPRIQLRAEDEVGGYFRCELATAQVFKDLVDLIQYRIQPLIVLRILNAVFVQKLAHRIDRVQLDATGFRVIEGWGQEKNFPWERYESSALEHDKMAIYVKEGITAAKKIFDTEYGGMNVCLLPGIMAACARAYQDPEPGSLSRL